VGLVTEKVISVSKDNVNLRLTISLAEKTAPDLIISR